MSYGTSTEAELREVDALTPGSPPVAAKPTVAASRAPNRSWPHSEVVFLVFLAVTVAVDPAWLCVDVHDASLRSIAADERAIEQRVDLAKAASDARDAGRRLDDIRRRMDEIQREMDALISAFTEESWRRVKHALRHRRNRTRSTRRTDFASRGVPLPVLERKDQQ